MTRAPLSCARSGSGAAAAPEREGPEASQLPALRALEMTGLEPVAYTLRTGSESSPGMLADAGSCAQPGSETALAPLGESAGEGPCPALSTPGCQEKRQCRADPERVARDLLRLAASAPDPRPLIVAAHALLDMAAATNRDAP